MSTDLVTISIPDALMLYDYGYKCKYPSIADITSERNKKTRDELLAKDTLTNRKLYVDLVNAAYDLLEDLLKAKKPNMELSEHMLPEHYIILKYGSVEYFKKFKKAKDLAYEKSQTKHKH